LNVISKPVLSQISHGEHEFDFPRAGPGFGKATVGSTVRGKKLLKL